MCGLLGFLSFDLNAAQNAIVVTDGAIVYKKADFDSSIIGYFRAGEKVKISERTFGPFYRVRFKQGITGYIADIDVNPQGKKISSKKSEAASSNKSEKKSTNRESSQNRAGPITNKSLMTRTLFGISLGMVNWSELFLQREYSDSLTFFGLKASFPFGKILSGPFVLDLTSIFSFTAGDYLKAASTVAPSGLIAMVDASVLYVFSEMMNRKFIGYMGGGPVVTYNNFNVEISGSKVDLLEVKVGGVITAGAGYKFSTFVLKGEGKYYFTESNQLALLLSGQVAF